MEHFDIVVIGSGAGGGTLVHQLADTGKHILLLERGEYLAREKQNWSSESVWGEVRYRNSGRWTDGAKGSQFLPKQHYYVGGNTKFYGAVLFRMREHDFGAVQHVDGESPAWPITYDDLEPYYSRGLRSSITCTATTASTRQSRRQVRRTRTRRSVTSRASPNFARTLPRRGYIRSRCRSG